MRRLSPAPSQARPAGSAVAPGAGASLLREGALYTVAVFAPMGMSVLVTPLVTRGLGASEYGQVALGVAVYQTAAVLLALGLPAAVTRDAVLEGGGSRRAAGTALTGALLAMVLGGLLAAVAWVSGASVGGAPAVVAALALLSGGSLAALTVAQSYLRAQHRVVEFVVLAVANAALGPVAGLVGVSAGWLRAPGYLGAICVVQLGCALVGLGLVGPRGAHRSRAAMGAAVRVGLPTVPHQLATGALSAGLVLVAGHTAGTAAAGELQIALLVGTVTVLLLGAFNNSWAPQVYARPPEDRAAYVSRTAPAVALAAAAAACTIAVLAPVALAVLAPSSIATPRAATAAAVAAAAAPVSVLYLANVHLVFASGRTGLLALTSPASLGLALGCAVVGAVVPSVDPLVAGAAGLLAFHVSQSLLSRVVCRRVSVSAPRIGGLAVVAVVSTAFCLAVAFWGPPMPLRVALAALVIVVAVVASVRARRAGAGGEVGRP